MLWGCRSNPVDHLSDTTGHILFMSTRYKVATSKMSDSDSQSTSSESMRYPVDGTFSKMVESGQIGFRLAEEIKALREELLVVKQDKRILLVSNENLETSLENANNNITDMHVRLVDLKNRANQSEVELTKKESVIKICEDDIDHLKKQLLAEKKKNRLLGEELERSLEDEVTLRSYSRRLEQDVVALKEAHDVAGEVSKAESEERAKCEQFIDTALRSQLIFQKKLETVVFYCDKDVDINAVSILDVSPDYLESLLRDMRSETVGAYRTASGGPAVGTRAKLDFSVLEHKQKLIDHHLNQYLNNIREHVSKHRKNQAKSHRHIRRLLDVVRTYEELPLVDGPSAYAHQPAHHWLADANESPRRQTSSGSTSDNNIHYSAEWSRELAQLRHREQPLVEGESERNRERDRGAAAHCSVSHGPHGARSLHRGDQEQPGREHSFAQAASAPPSRHHHARENSPSPARHGPSPPRRHCANQADSRQSSSRSLVLLEQLQREMERELRV